MNKHKRLLLTILLICLCFLTIDQVFAANCNGILTRGAADLLKKIVGWIRILVPILLIILGVVDFGSAAISEDKDNLKKATSKFMKRCLAALAVFFIPLLVELLLNLPGIKDNINLVDDPMCGVEE